MAIDLFGKENLVGIFKGFIESGLEFAADIIAPYKGDLDLAPRAGQLLLVELSTPDEALLGRITRFVPVGIMAGFEGDEYLTSLHKQGENVPEQLKEDRLRYSVRVKLLGGIKISKAIEDSITFIPSVRRLPHLGSKVSYPSVAILRHLCQLGAKNAILDSQIGYYALGEVIYNGGRNAGEDYFESRGDEIPVHFDIHSLVGKRSFVFARAGYGKSNMMKYLLSELYRNPPTVKIGNISKSVGTLVFDPEGEYFWPDESGRPGLCNVPHLKDRMAIFTNRPRPNKYYGSWKIDNLKLDLSELPPSEVVSLCIPEGKHEHQNVIKIRTIDRQVWPTLVRLFHEQRYNASIEAIRNATGIGDLSEVECIGMRNNLVPIIDTHHSPESSLLTLVPSLLRLGRIVIVDMSLVSGAVGLQIAGMLMNRIFYGNQESFTDPHRGLLMPTIVVLEEAQSVLGKSSKEDSPFVSWVKEGRKYSLGAILITQQPGSIMPELLSQGDNFFSFHLLSAHDLKTLQFHNAHFSDDVLAHLLNEPIKGNAFFWSAPHQPFVLPARIMSFEGEYEKYLPSDEDLNEAVNTGLDEYRGARENLLLRLAGNLNNNIAQNKIKVYSIESCNDHYAFYKPQLSAAVADLLTEEEKATYCKDQAKTFVPDGFLNDVLLNSGLFGPTISSFKGRRASDEKEGVFIEIDISSLCSNTIPRDNISKVQQ